MKMILFVSACFGLLAALPVTLALWLILTRPAPKSETTQTGEPYYAELSCGDSEHLPYYARVEAAISDAIIQEETDRQRIERVRRQMEAKRVQVIRAVSDKKETQTDHTLQIIK